MHPEHCKSFASELFMCLSHVPFQAAVVALGAAAFYAMNFREYFQIMEKTLELATVGGLVQGILFTGLRRVPLLQRHSAIAVAWVMLGLIAVPVSSWVLGYPALIGQSLLAEVTGLCLMLGIVVVACAYVHCLAVFTQIMSTEPASGGQVELPVVRPRVAQEAVVIPSHLSLFPVAHATAEQLQRMDLERELPQLD